jgi:hypothetical protein
LICLFASIANTAARMLIQTTATKQPTNPDSANESSASSTHMDNTLVSSHTLPPSSLLNANSNNNSNHATNGSLTPGATGVPAVSSAHSMMAGVSYGDTTNFDFFDPQHWMLDGLLDFNYSFVPALEGA